MADRTTLPFVSVMIPTLNRPDAIIQIATDFLAQVYPSLEVIVVDQSQAVNQGLARLEQRDGRLKVIRTNVIGTCHARNLGVREAQGSIVVFSDDDNRIRDTSFVWQHIQNFGDPTIGGVGGRVLDRNTELNREQTGPVCTVTKTGKVFPNATSLTRQLINAPRGGNMSFRKSVILGVGGFDERFRGNAMREETDFSLRVVEGGWRIIYDPLASNEHLALAGGSRSSDRITWYEDFFFNESLFFLKHFPRRYLPILLFRKVRPMIICAVYYGRFQPRALTAPWRAFRQAWRLVQGPGTITT